MCSGNHKDVVQYGELVINNCVTGTNCEYLHGQVMHLYGSGTDDSGKAEGSSPVAKTGYYIANASSLSSRGCYGCLV